MSRKGAIHQLYDDLPVAPLALAGLAAGFVFVLSVVVFPYHSTNHDEAVYLQQAAMLLDGQLFLRPPVEGAFRPWFFVESSQGLYSKYAPVTAAVFAFGELAGSFRYALPAVAGANVALLYGVVREAFDHRTGLVAGVALVCSPLFLVQSAVFLPYAPTTMWNLLFAFAYFRAERIGSVGWAALAGAATGLAFFARPYTAVLFAVPFIVHALVTLRGPLRERAITDLARRRTATAAFGLVGVVVALGYNAVVTGDPFVFPYQAFAPLDGLGFGRREILNYERTYTPELALRANALVVLDFVTEWGPFGVLGSLLAVVGVGVTHLRGWSWRKAVLGGVAVSVVVGNVAFWGNLNVLGDLSNPNDGLVDTLGPYYHMDLLVPTSTFAAVGLLGLLDRCQAALRARLSPRRAGAVALAVVLATSGILGAAAASAAAQPIADNADITENYEAAYEPFEPSPPSNAVVFLPDPYGDWLNHPFQALRNNPGFDGETVYALQERQLAVVDAYPDRDYYRYVIRGGWAPYSGGAMNADLRPISVTSGESLAVDVEMGLPSWTAGVTLTVSAGGERILYTLDDLNQSANVDVVVEDGRVRLAGPVTPTGNESVALDDTVEVRTFVDGGYGAGFFYQVRVPVERAGDSYRALTPYLELCTDLRDCGGGAAYVPGAGPAGTFLNATVRTRS
jgi:hypothetical protein